MGIMLVSGCSILANHALPTLQAISRWRASRVPARQPIPSPMITGGSVARPTGDNELSYPRELRVGQRLTISSASNYVLLYLSERLPASVL